MSKTKYVRVPAAPDVVDLDTEPVVLDVVDYGPVPTPPRNSGDASFLTGLLLGLGAGAALVMILSPAFQQRVEALAQEWGLTGAAAGPAADGGASEVLAHVPPPPDPLSSGPAA